MEALIQAVVVIRRRISLDRGNDYRRYLLVLLAAVYGFNSVDRMALGLVLQNIKADFRISDTEIGILTGTAFAVFYSVLGIPIGRWADRGNRVTIIGLTTALWSAMVMLSAAARSFTQLLLIRVGVAVGEAGCVPPAYSLIADYFMRAERPQAVATYLLGGSFSVIVGYFAAGWLNELYGWRVMFFVLGMPGIALAAVSWSTLREPRIQSGGASEGVWSDPGVFGISQVLWALGRNKTFRRILAATCISSFFGFGIIQWQPAFFIRSYGFHTGELGIWFTVIYGAGGIIGTYGGGRLATRYAPANEGLQLRALAVLNTLCGFVSAFAYLSSSAYIAFGLIGLAAIGATLENGPRFATIQTVSPERMRAVSISVVFLFANLIGLGLGPLAVGAMSDALRPLLGQESLRYALVAMCPGYIWGSWLLWRAGTTAAEDVDMASRGAAPGAQCAVSEDAEQEVWKVSWAGHQGSETSGARNGFESAKASGYSNDVCRSGSSL